MIAPCHPDGALAGAALQSCKVPDTLKGAGTCTSTWTDSLSCHAGALDTLVSAVYHCKVEPLQHPADSLQASTSNLSELLPASGSVSRTSSAADEELSRARHASWQELPPELIALIFQRATIRERKLCKAPLAQHSASGFLCPKACAD